MTVDTIHVYPVATPRPHVLREDCWCEPTVEHVAATEPQPEPPAPVEPPPDDEVPDEPVEEPATPEEGEP